MHLISRYHGSPYCSPRCGSHFLCSIFKSPQAPLVLILQLTPKIPPIPPGILRLPSEIHILIASHLDSSPESIIARALSCKPLYHLLGADVKKLRSSCRLSVLSLLEKDLGANYFTAQCAVSSIASTQDGIHYPRAADTSSMPWGTKVTAIIDKTSTR